MNYKFIVVKGHSGFADLINTLLKAITLSNFLTEKNIQNCIQIEWDGWVIDDFFDIQKCNYQSIKLPHTQNTDKKTIVESTIDQKLFNNFFNRFDLWDIWVLKDHHSWSSFLHKQYKQLINITSACLTTNVYKNMFCTLYFKHVHLKPNITLAVKQKLLEYDLDNYISIATRLSDYSSSKYYKTIQDAITHNINLIEKHASNHLNEKILLHSDNVRVVEAFLDYKRYFNIGAVGEYFIKNKIELPDTCSLHRIPDLSNKHKNNNFNIYLKSLYTIMDFYSMINSKKVYVSEHGHFSKEASKLNSYAIENNINILHE